MHLVFLGAMIDTKVENKNYLKKNYIKDLLHSCENKNREALLKDLRNWQKEMK
jgi:hypothetical protein